MVQLLLFFLIIYLITITIIDYLSLHFSTPDIIFVNVLNVGTGISVDIIIVVVVFAGEFVVIIPIFDGIIVSFICYRVISITILFVYYCIVRYYYYYF